MSHLFVNQPERFPTTPLINIRQWQDIVVSLISIFVSVRHYK